MSIWGKVIGGVGGFAFGGPLGAILGAAAGHAYDKAKAAKAGPGGVFSQNALNQQDRQVAFTTAIIVLSAKMAKADGQVTREEVDAFKQVFQIPPDEAQAVGALFNEAKKDAGGFEPYAKQIAEMFAGQPEVLEELLGGLLHIAKADGHIHPEEKKYLLSIVMVFGFSEQSFERLMGIHGGDEKSDPYQVIGVTRETSNEDIKKAYRQLIQKNHPDRLIAQGLPQEFIDLANEKMAAINAAYDQIEKDRGIK